MTYSQNWVARMGLVTEVPVKKLVDEIKVLSAAEGEHSRTYCKGAIAALEWVLRGGDGPSKTEILLFKDGSRADH